MTNFFQPPLPIFTSEQGECGSPVRKSFLTSPNNNLAAISQQLNNLGTINHQLNTLTQQLSGLNQQSQNLQQFQNFGNNFSSSQNVSMNSVPTNNNNSNSAKTQENLLQNDLFQSNQELLNRLQNLSLGFSNNNNSINSKFSSSQNSYMFTNPSQYLTNNNHLNLLNSPSSVGNLTPSPILNRSSYSSSPLLDNSLGIGVSMERNLDRNSGHGECSSGDDPITRPLSRISSMQPLDSDDVIKKMMASDTKLDATPSSASGTLKKNEKRVTLPDFMLKVTDESGNITNARKLSATPSFITRSTSEKVPNRSQMMSDVQRTAWARHTTK